MRATAAGILAGTLLLVASILTLPESEGERKATAKGSGRIPSRDREVAEPLAESGIMEAVFRHPSVKPSPKTGDVIISFQPANLLLQTGQSATVTVTISPPDAVITFAVQDSSVAVLAGASRSEGTAQLTLRGEKVGATFLSAQGAGRIVFGALPLSVGAPASKPAGPLAFSPASRSQDRAAAAAEEQLFTVSKTLSMTLMPGAPGDFVHGDLVAFKAPVDSPNPIPPFLKSLVWVGGQWADGYSDWFTQTGYITANNGMNCGPDGELTFAGTVNETLAGGGGEGLWFFAAFVHVRISDGGSWFWNSPFAVLTATQRITITSNGATTTLEAGQTYTQGDYALQIKKAPTSPPNAVAETTTLLIPKGGIALLDGSDSSDTDENGESIVEWIWLFDNQTTPEDDRFSVPSTTAYLQQTLTEPGEYLVTLTVKDDEGELSTPNGSDSHVTIQVVGVSFDPTSITVRKGSNISVKATVTPANAVAAVSFRIESPEFADVTPAALTSSPGNLTVAGKKVGSTLLVADVTTVNGSEEVTSIPVAVVVGPDIEVKGGLFIIQECNDETGFKPQKEQLWISRLRHFSVSTNRIEGKFFSLELEEELCPDSEGKNNICRHEDAPNRQDFCDCGEKLRFLKTDSTGKHKCDDDWPLNPPAKCAPYDGRCLAENMNKDEVQICTGIRTGAYHVRQFECNNEQARIPGSQLVLPNVFRVFSVDADGWTGNSDTSTRDPFPDLCVGISGAADGTKRSHGTPIQITLKGPSQTSVKVRIKNNSPFFVVSKSAELQFGPNESINNAVRRTGEFPIASFTMQTDADCTDRETLYIHGIQAGFERDDQKLELEAEEIHTICQGGLILDSPGHWVLADTEKFSIFEVTISDPGKIPLNGDGSLFVKVDPNLAGTLVRLDFSRIEGTSGEARFLDGTTTNLVIGTQHVFVKGTQVSLPAGSRNVRMTAALESERGHICQTRDFEIADCSDEFSDVSFTLRDQVAEGYKDNADLLVNNATNPAEARLELTIRNPVKYTPKVTINTNGDENKAKEFEVGFSQTVEDFKIDIEYKSGVRKLIRVNPLPIKDGDRGQNYDELFVVKPEVEHIAEVFKSDGHEVELIQVDTPRAIAAFHLNRDQAYTGQFPDSTLKKMVLVGSLRTWVVIRHKPSGCIKKLHHIDWAINLQAKLDEKNGQIVGSAKGDLVVSVPNGDGSPPLIRGGPVPRQSFTTIFEDKSGKGR